MLKLNEIHTYYGESHILQGVTLEIPAGSVVALLGRNGMGKTTTIYSISGLNEPKVGEIFFKGKNIVGQAPHRIARMGMALVPQGRRLFPSLTVQENLTIGQRTDNNWNYHLEDIYKLFPALKDRARHKGTHLSGGEQQMVSIGRALLTNPELLLMDEPFEGLAPAIINNMSENLLEIKKSGLSILLVEQNIPVALRLADYVYIMSKGKIAYGGTSDQFTKDYKALKGFFLL